MYPLGVELTQEWEQLKQEVEKYPPLSIQAPLQVRSIECTPPVMIPTVPKRILCFSHGEDNSSTLTPEQVTNMLLKNKIIMDSVLLSNDITYSHFIAKASGGCSFRPKSCPELLAIFENEPMLTLKMRRHVKPLLSPCDDGDPNLSQSREERKISGVRSPLTYSSIGLMFNTVRICSGWLTNGISSNVDEEIDHIFPDQLEKPAITMHKCLAIAMRQKLVGKTVHNSTHTKRLLQELAYYAKESHAGFKIYPCEENIGFWQLILFGPKDTSYEDGIFHLFIEFTDKYPSKPPNIRFITPIYHCNINQAGKVCHSILDRFYSPGIRIRQILDYIYGLLMDPAPDDPLDTVKATELKFNLDLYMNNARAYTAKHAKQYKTAIDLQKLILKGNDDSSTHDVEYVCPLTGELFVDAQLTKYGDSYEKEAILAHIRNVGE